VVSKTYPSNLSGLRARVYNRMLTASSAPGSVTDEKIRASLNDGQREVQNELLLAFHARYFVKTDKNLSPVNNRIELPADFKRTVGLAKVFGSEWIEVALIPSSHYEKFRMREYPQQTGALTYQREPWALVHNHYEFVGNGTVTGTYRHRWQYMIPDLQSDDDHTEIPEDYQEMLVDYAAWIMEEDSGTVERADRLAMRYQRRISQLRRTSKQISLNEDKRIRDVRGIRGF